MTVSLVAFVHSDVSHQSTGKALVNFSPFPIFTLYLSTFIILAIIAPFFTEDIAHLVNTVPSSFKAQLAFVINKSPSWGILILLPFMLTSNRLRLTGRISFSSLIDAIYVAPWLCISLSLHLMYSFQFIPISGIASSLGFLLCLSSFSDRRFGELFSTLQTSISREAVFISELLTLIYVSLDVPALYSCCDAHLGLHTVLTLFSKTHMRSFTVTPLLRFYECWFSFTLLLLTHAWTIEIALSL